MLILEYMEHGSLYDILQNNTVVLEGEITLPILRDMSQGMRFLHEANPRILHGDLKAQNILVDKRFRAKVADFGFSQNKDIGGTGTPYWMAPELLRYESPNTSKSDVFSFGGKMRKRILIRVKLLSQARKKLLTLCLVAETQLSCMKFTHAKTHSMAKKQTSF